MDALSAAALGVVLAATAGLRAFLPVFSASLAAWLTELPLGTCFQSGDLPRADSELRLDEARGECQGAGDRVRDAIRTRLSLQSRTY